MGMRIEGRERCCMYQCDQKRHPPSSPCLHTYLILELQVVSKSTLPLHISTSQPAVQIAYTRATRIKAKSKKTSYVSI